MQLTINPLAEHIAEFTGKKVKFQERKFLKFLRRNRRKTAKRSRTTTNSEP